jgi:protein-tyrosine phosphatase
MAGVVFGLVCCFQTRSFSDVFCLNGAWFPVSMALFSFVAAFGRLQLRENGIRRGIELRRVPVQDFNPEEVRQKLPACVQALGGLVRVGHTVYVHCNAGVNRSPSVVIAYLHWVQKMPFNEAVAYVIKRHPSDPYVEAIRLATEDRGGGG